MNRLLARMVGVLNRLLAALFLVGGPIVGATFGAHYSFHVVREAVIGFLVGLVAGAFLAVVVCGLLALTCPFTTRSTTSTACWRRQPRTPRTGTPHQTPVLFHRSGSDRLSARPSPQARWTASLCVSGTA